MAMTFGCGAKATYGFLPLYLPFRLRRRQKNAQIPREGSSILPFRPWGSFLEKKNLQWKKKLQMEISRNFKIKEA